MASSSLRALTRAHTLRKILSPRVVAPFSLRSLSSTTHTTNGSDSGHSKQCANGEASTLVNRFLKEGPSTPHEVMNDEKAVYARLDMPGIGIERLKVWVEGNSIHVNGEEDVGREFWRHYYPRKYSGNIEIPLGFLGCYDVEEITAEFNNGVLMIKIPKRKHIITVIKVNVIHPHHPCPDKTCDFHHDDLVFVLFLCACVFNFGLPLLVFSLIGV